MPSFSHIAKNDIPIRRIKKDEDIKSRYRYSDNDLEHRAVMAKQVGRKLRFDEKVHHKDSNDHNNDSSNLQIMTQKAHLGLHRDQGDILGRPKLPLAEYHCQQCGVAFYRKRYIKPTPQYCGHSCHGKAMFVAGRKSPRLGTGVPVRELHCEYCNSKLLFIQKKGNRQSRFCNRSCSMKYTRRDGYNPRGNYDWTEIFCEGCGKEFMPTRKQKTNLSHNRPVYCTRECFNQYGNTGGYE